MSFPQWQIRRVTHLTESELNTAAENCTACYFADKNSPMGPATVGAFPGNYKELVFRYSKYTIKEALRDGEVYTAGDNFAGMACWFGPGQEFLGSEEQVSARGFEREFADVPDLFKDWWAGEWLPKWSRLAPSSLPHGHAAIRNGYHLQMKFVRPDAQGKGIATALIRDFLTNRADHEGKFVTTETSSQKTVARYNKLFGFTARGESTMASPPGSTAGPIAITLLGRDPI